MNEVLEYRNRCQLVCNKLDLQLIGFTPNKGFACIVGKENQEISHEFLERLEKVLK